MSSCVYVQFYLFLNGLFRDENGTTPIRYEMLGYDSLLGSHFDKYEIVYSDYRAGPVDRDMFKVNEVISKYLESHAFCQ